MLENNGEQRTPSPEAGVMQYADEKHTARVGTQLYMSPEQVSYHHHVTGYQVLAKVLWHYIVTNE